MDASGEQSEKATRRATGEPPAELLARLDDPVAEQTEWTPRVRRGTHLHTHRLVQDSVSQWSMRPTLSVRVPSALFCLLFVAMGGMLVFAGVAGLRNPVAVFSQSGWAGLILLLFPLGGVLLAFVGIRQYRWVCQPRVFDLQANRYWRGKRPSDFGTPEDDANAAPLDQVHAVQILGELVRGTKATDFRDFHSYEINLVLHDATRVNVVDHGNLKHIRKDAQTIANLIGVPLWDATA